MLCFIVHLQSHSVYAYHINEVSILSLPISRLFTQKIPDYQKILKMQIPSQVIVSEIFGEDCNRPIVSNKNLQFKENKSYFRINKMDTPYCTIEAIT